MRRLVTVFLLGIILGLWVDRLAHALSAPKSVFDASSPWDKLRETIAPTPTPELTFADSSNVLLSVSSTSNVWSLADIRISPQTVDVTDFEGRGLRRIGTIDSAGVFHLTKGVCP